MKKLNSAVLALAMTGCFSTVTLAQDLSPAEQLDTRKKVETAVALSEIAVAEKDGAALLVAARILASAGKVARRDSGDTAEPTFYSVSDLTEAAKGMGADAAKADEIAASHSSDRGICYWDYECGTFECGWLYICE